MILCWISCLHDLCLFLFILSSPFCIFTSFHSTSYFASCSLTFLYFFHFFLTVPFYSPCKFTFFLVEDRELIRRRWRWRSGSVRHLITIRKQLHTRHIVTIVHFRFFYIPLLLPPRTFPIRSRSATIVQLSFPLLPPSSIYFFSQTPIFPLFLLEEDKIQGDKTLESISCRVEISSGNLLRLCSLAGPDSDKLIIILY